jgi:hypothetical protein
MFVATTATRIARSRSQGARSLTPGIKPVCSFVVFLVLLAQSARAIPTITLAGGVQNPPPNVVSNVPETAVADKATLVKVSDIAGLLQSVLNAQGFTNANNWILSQHAVFLDANATFNITDYHLFLNGTSDQFGENMDFTLDPNLAPPAAAPPGATSTLHWLQMLNEDRMYPTVSGDFGFAIAGQPGFWQMDNGDKTGSTATGATTGPYYDSNSAGGFSVPPSFHDAPKFYSGVGSYLHFTAIPTWDVYFPDTIPPSETIKVADYGVAWGFSIVPEPSAVLLMFIGSSLIALARRRRWR